MNKSCCMAHPLRCNSTGIITEYPEFKIFPWIKRYIRFYKKPSLPICIFLPYCRNIRIIWNMPTWPIIIPDLFNFSNLTQFSREDYFPYLLLYGIANPLGPQLYNL